MIRMVFYLLLLANAGVLLWHISSGSSQQTQIRVPDPAVKSLMLLAERDGEQPPEPASSSSGDSVALNPAVPGGVCYTLGPFRSQDGAAQAREALQELKLKPSGRVRNEREQYGYQVYLPPFEDREAAIAAARELAEQDITEYYIMNEETLRNAISLGLFRSKQHAERQVEKFRQKGIFVEMLPRYRDRKLYWLDYSDPRQLLTTAAVRQLFPDDPVQRLTRKCG